MEKLSFYFGKIFGYTIKWQKENNSNLIKNKHFCLHIHHLTKFERIELRHRLKRRKEIIINYGDVRIYGIYVRKEKMKCFINVKAIKWNISIHLKQNNISQMGRHVWNTFIKNAHPKIKNVRRSGYQTAGIR